MLKLRRAERWLSLGLICSMASCLAYAPSDPRPEHLQIAWRADVADAAAAMQASNKPGLIVAVAGDIRGSC